MESILCKSSSALHPKPVVRSATMDIGNAGEELACQYLIALGYTVLGRNIRLSRDEVDILAHDPVDDVLVFAEVKSRTRLDPDYRPELNLTPRKRRAMTRATRRWAAENDYDGGCRMDLICVAAGRVIDHQKELESGEEKEGGF